MFKVQLSDHAKRSYAEAAPPLAKRLARCFRQLEDNPHQHPNIKPLKGRWRCYYRYRVGDYRVVYRGDDAGHVVIVAIIAHRREAYR